MTDLFSPCMISAHRSPIKAAAARLRFSTRGDGVIKMKVILQTDVKGQGTRGQIVTVSDGYARNFLFPRKLAIAATTDALNAIKLHDAAVESQIAHDKQLTQQTADRLKDCLVKVHAKAGDSGRLFGSVTSGEIAEALAEQHSIEVDKRKIVLDEPIKQFGTFEVKAKLGYEITATLFVVVSEEKA